MEPGIRLHSSMRVNGHMEIQKPGNECYGKSRKKSLLHCWNHSDSLVLEPNRWRRVAGVGFGLSLKGEGRIQISVYFWHSRSRLLIIGQVRSWRCFLGWRNLDRLMVNARIFAVEFIGQALRFLELKYLCAPSRPSV